MFSKMFSKAKIFEFGYSYLRYTSRIGAVSGFTLGFTMCDVAEKPLTALN